MEHGPCSMVHFVPLALCVSSHAKIYYRPSEGPMKKFTLVPLMILSAATAFSADLRLIDAVKKSDAKTVRSLIAQRVDVKSAEADGSTALHWAAQRDNLDIVDLLLRAGANATAANRYN